MSKYMYQNIIYNSKSKLSEATGINRKSLLKIIKDIPENEDGIVVVDGVIKTYLDSKITYTYEGIEYSTVNEAADAVGLKNATLSKYLKLADNDMEKAMKLYFDEHTYCIIDGKRYFRQSDLADELGVTVTTLVKYIDSEGSVESAVKAIKKIKEDVENNVYEWQEKKYFSLESVAKAMGIPRPTLKRILENQANGNLDTAYQIYQSRNSGKYHGYEYDGVKYGSLKKLLAAYGLSEHKYREKLKEHNDDFKSTIDALIQEKEEAKRLELEAQEREEKINAIFAEIELEYDIPEKELKSLIRTSLETHTDFKELIVRYERTHQKYIFGGNIYETIAAVSRVSGISETQLRRLVDKFGNDLDFALNEKSKPIVYTYDGKTFESIKALADYTGIKELRLGRYIRKYDRNAEKAIYMIRLRDTRRKKVSIETSDISPQDMAVVLGIKYSELIACLNRGMSLDDIKKLFSNSKEHLISQKSSNIMYKGMTLYQYCIENGLNYSCIYYSITEYNKTPEEAIENYKSAGQEIPTDWIFERYDVLLKHLLLSEKLDYKKIIATMRACYLPLEDAIEKCIIGAESKKRELESNWEEELYYLFKSISSQEERDECIKEFWVTQEELQCMENIKNRFNEVKRKMLLFEFASCMKAEVFTKDELAELMSLYNISDDELEIIFLDLYKKFNYGVLLAQNEPQLIKRNIINEHIRNWGQMTEQEKEEVKQKYPEDYEDIVKTFEDIQGYKELLKVYRKDQEIISRMKGTVHEHVGEIAETRAELESEIALESEISIIED